LRKSRFWDFGDRQTNKQVDSSDALSRSRYRERRLNNLVKFGENWLITVRENVQNIVKHGVIPRAHAKPKEIQILSSVGANKVYLT